MSTTTIGRGRGRGRGRGLITTEQKPGTVGVVRNADQPKTNSSPPNQPSPSSSTSLNETTPPSESSKQTTSPPSPAQPTQQEQRTPSQQSQTLSRDELKLLISKLDSTTESEMNVNYTLKFRLITTQSQMDEFVELVCEKALLEPETCPLISRLCNLLWNNTTQHSLIRTPLLKKMQNKFSHRDPKRRQYFYGLCVFLCELYKVLRLKHLTLKPLTNPICQILKELLETGTPSADDALYFYQELESVGQILEKDSPEKMEEIVNTARQVGISSSVTPQARCRLVQLIELRAANWKMDPEVKTIYEDIFMDF